MFIPPPPQSPVPCVYGSIERPIEPELADTYNGRPIIDEVYWARCRLHEGVAESELRAWMLVIDPQTYPRTIERALSPVCERS